MFCQIGHYVMTRISLNNLLVLSKIVEVVILLSIELKILDLLRMGIYCFLVTALIYW